MSFTLGAVLIVAAVVVFILQPLLTGERSSMERTEDEMSEAEAERRVKLLALRDVEYDYVTGKLDDSDYQALRRELSSEALEAMKRVEEEAEGEAGVEREVARMREDLRKGLTCPSCGTENRPGSRFCAGCGLALSSAAPTGS